LKQWTIKKDTIKAAKYKKYLDEKKLGRKAIRAKRETRDKESKQKKITSAKERRSQIMDAFLAAGGAEKGRVSDRMKMFRGA